MYHEVHLEGPNLVWERCWSETASLRKSCINWDLRVEKKFPGERRSVELGANTLHLEGAGWFLGWPCFTNYKMYFFKLKISDIRTCLTIDDILVSMKYRIKTKTRTEKPREVGEQKVRREEVCGGHARPHRSWEGCWPLSQEQRRVMESF